VWMYHHRLPVFWNGDDPKFLPYVARVRVRSQTRRDSGARAPAVFSRLPPGVDTSNKDPGQVTA
jgi:hypothetical protein